MAFRIRFKLIATLVLLALLAATSTAPAEEEKKAPRDLSGRWVVLLSNSLSRKQITFEINQEDGRLRGSLLASGLPEQKLDGRFEDDNRIILWGTYYDRSGASMDYQFKGTFEGEPGEETLQGQSEYFRKRYDFVAERAD